MHVTECLTHSKLGGGQSVILTLVRQLRRLHPEIHFSIILPAGGVFVERFRDLGVQVVELPFDTISPLTAARTWKTLLQLQPDVIHSHGKGAGLYARLVSRRRIRARRVHSYHGFHPPEFRPGSTLYRAVESRLLAHTDAIISVSESEGSEIRRTFPGFGSTVTVIPNAVDCEDLHTRSSCMLPAELDSFLHANHGRCIVTMIARNDDVKDYPLALRVAHLALEKTPNVSFVFVGIDPSDADCLRLCRQNPARVFVRSALDDTSSLLRRSTVIMLTSKKEGNPLVVHEAFCFGKPVVATNVEGTRDVVQHDVNGLLATREEDVASAIETVVMQKDVYERLARNAAETASRTNVAEWAGRYYRIYTRGVE